MNCVIRIPVFSSFACAKTKGADQLHGNRAADQCHCFRYIDSKIPLLPKSEFEASNHLLSPNIPVCVRPGWKQVFS